MQKIISHLFTLGTTQQSSEVVPTVVQTTEAPSASSHLVVQTTEAPSASSHLVVQTTEAPLASSHLCPSSQSCQATPLSGSDTPISIPSDEGSDEILPHCLKEPKDAGSGEHDSPLMSSELMQLYQKSCSRMNFAAKMSAALFDEETRLTHNVAGRGKPKLDPNLIDYIKVQSFEFFPCKSADLMEKEWSECIKAIDERSRRLKKQKAPK